jgi:AcrR family transcriptional regulator
LTSTLNSLSKREQRPHRLDREQRQTEILDAAFTLFTEKGYGPTTISDIAEGLVLFYFNSKEEVFQAVVKRAIPPILKDLSDIATRPGLSATKMLSKAVQQLYSDLVVKPSARAILKLLVAEGHRFPELTAYYHSLVFTPGHMELNRIIKHGVKTGEFQVPPGDYVTNVLIAPIIEAIFMRILFDQIETIDLKRLQKTHFELILKGLSPRS